MTHYFPFHPSPRRPIPLPPALSCDAQFHVLGDPAHYPPRPDAAYQMPSATIERALAMHKMLGITRGVIVQTTTYGADHRIVLDGLKRAGENYRGCANAVLFATATDKILNTLHEAGVRGARFSFRQELGVRLSQADFDRAIAIIRELGWYVKIQPEKSGVVEGASFYEKLNIPVLIDHMGRPDPEAGDQDPNLLKMIELLKRGNFWVMLSLAEKTSRQGPPWDDVLPITRRYIETAPDRVVWGSDWPHPLSVKPPPNDAELLEFLVRCAPDAEEQKAILVDNPAHLFGF